VAQSILTLLEFKGLHADNVALANRVFDWAVENMWDRRGFFYYRVLPFCKIRTSYMRWSQAWMLIAVSTLAEERRSRPSAAANAGVAQLAGSAI
jgi:hypothetical protein